ncbi:prepilin-type N-terminal cleavage/methylation domain-containing protein [Pontiella sp.]|uniref:prepilin-type N-terminal cleavage/methylation domain-containing protein n=1 Tax=Pontiella sp. TaxID=2837462 RepID=UPI00356246F8
MPKGSTFQVSRFKLQASRGGFTLLELLVALALLAILSGSIAGVLKNSADSVAQGTAAMDQLTRLRSLETVLGGALRDAQISQVSTLERSLLADDPSYDAANGRYRFRGEELALGFVLERPFLEAEYDGYMHWITIEVRTDEATESQSLWMTDTSYLQGIDNPVGPDWSDAALDEAWKPVKEVMLLGNTREIFFRYWKLQQTGMTDEPEKEEMEFDDIDTDYSVRLPDLIELVMSVPNLGTESLMFDYSIRRKGI